MDTFTMDTCSEEYQLLMAYCSRRKRLRHPPFSVGDAMHSMVKAGGSGIIPQGPSNSKPMFPLLLKRRIIDVSRGSYPSAVAEAEGSSLSKVADRLSDITDSVKITTDETILPDVHLEPDGPVEDDIIQRLVALLKASGDKLDEDIKRNPTLLKQLQTSFTYGLFEKVTNTLLRSVMGGEPGAQYGCLDPAEEVERVQREKIALACEVTNRLSALELHPMNKAMGFGAHYLKQHHTDWVKKHGGWSKAFDIEDTD
ncbi:hypothetical protein UPYG_G00269120 [Umbra pygmaea]|uniref:Apoptosis facilitator Bcl-2-like protein 14 n=1 Tax=Umbra pygmaea TaxID=75934 RepID=A0ABD0X0X8_UMBPY